MVLSVLETLRKLEAYLAKAGLERPKVEAEWLTAEVLGCKRLELFLQWDRPVEAAARERLREAARRRAVREPLQYIIGYQDFHDIRVAVGPGVLIPRPETEELVEGVLKRLGGVGEPRIVDLGTGSGAIALALAKALPAARILAVDASEAALRRARENADCNGLRERVSFRRGDWLSGLSLRADCIVSNPPYLTEDEWRSAAPEVRDFEPREALVAAEEGLADLRRIVEGARSCLEVGGLLALECGVAHGRPLKALAEQVGYTAVQVEQDASGRDRFLFASG
jgi:release factor glutamine methyltransferase